MTTSRPTEGLRRVAREWGIYLFVVALLVFVGARVAWDRWPRAPTPPPREENESRPAPEDPRLAFATPYRNARPGVLYVGDEACAACHLDQAETYRRHPMGRSFAPVARAGPVERYDEEAHNPFEQFGARFFVEPRGERVFHKEVRRGARGRVFAEASAEVHFALGSGARGRSYLVNRDGYLFQSPVSWFSQKGAWDLSPGFTAESHFDRPVLAACLFCHCNDARPVEHTLNRYEEPLFGSYAIGCERCHGPGELHVARRGRGEAVEGPDDTIVNPGRLEPALREAVCQQCHLQGEQRVLRRGRQPFDYRPGLPLHLFWSVFVLRPGTAENARAVGQVEQMYASRCFRESNGKLGCTSCHDPHALPAPGQRAAYYRGRCLACHEEAGCSLPAADRRQRQPDDSCSACHMPRAGSSDIAHTAVTDHRVPRFPGGRPPSSAPRPARPGEVPLVHFLHDQVAAGDEGAARDLGVALAEMAWKADPARGRELARLAAPLLRAAVGAGADDVPAWEGLGGALQVQGEAGEALAALEAGLARAPGRERSLVGAALAAEALQRPDTAVAYWERAVSVNPWSAHSRSRLAKLLADRGEWRRAVEECRATLRTHPAGAETRLFLALCYLRLGDRDRAREEFDTALALDPSNEEELRRWFAEQAR